MKLFDGATPQKPKGGQRNPLLHGRKQREIVYERLEGLKDLPVN